MCVKDLSHDDEGWVPINYGANYERLATLKKKYDPRNIEPAKRVRVPAA